MSNPITELTGSRAFEFVDRQATAQRGAIAQMLAECDPSHTFVVWRNTLRLHEELFNLYLFHLDDDPLREAVGGLRLYPLQDAQLSIVASELAKKFTPALAQHFVLAIGQVSRLVRWWSLTGNLQAVSKLQTVAHAVNFFQAHRRHMVALLYAMPKGCRGTLRMPLNQCLALFMPRLSEHGLALVNLSRHLALLHVFSDYKVFVGEHGYTGSHYFETLDAAFSDPERASLLDMPTSARGALELEPVDPAFVFSSAELRNEFRKIATAYAEFDLESTVFRPITKFLSDCLAHVEDGYVVTIPYEEFAERLLASEIPESIQPLLLTRARNYVEALDEFAPFVRLGDVVLSTIPFMSRFAYHAKSLALNRNRRFQIRSGFIFEDAVKVALHQQGLAITDIRRIDGKEFDVVALLGDIVFNVQCKNNLIDLWRLDNEPLLFARYNRALDRYYTRALAKEQGREQLLLDRLKARTIRHIVVSRFPVATRNTNVMYFGEIENFRLRFANDLNATA